MPSDMPVKVLEDERVDDLERNGYRIIQKKGGFGFGIDAVLLSDFSKVKKNEQAIDLGTGTGIIPILLEARYKGQHYTGLEIQEDLADMASRSVKLNGLEDKITIISGDIKEADTKFGTGRFDVVTANPPYMNDDESFKNADMPKAIARHEIACTFNDVAYQASRLLKYGGRFYLVHRPRRLNEILHTLTKYSLEPKRMRFVHPFEDKEANMVLIEAVMKGSASLKIEPPLIVYKEPGIYSDEIYRIYRSDAQ